MAASNRSISPLSEPDDAGPSPSHTELKPVDPSRYSKRQSWTRLPAKWIWIPEFLSFLFAVLTLMAIVILLALRKDKPQPTWPSVLSINSLVAIFSSVLKAALLFSVAECIGELKWVWFTSSRPLSDFDRFDAATRGPWGAFLLLLKRPRNVVASTGTLITILALAVEPFSQQVLQFYSCRIPSTSLLAQVQRTNNYTEGIYSRFAGDPISGLSRKMMASLYRGLLDPPSNSSALMSSNHCPTGNCTFSLHNEIAYSTLAMCSSVEDISDLIRGRDSEESISSYQEWNYSLPSGISILGNQQLATAKIDNPTNNEATPMATIEALLVRSNCSGLPYGSQEKCYKKPWAIQLKISPCIHTYSNVSFKKAVFTEHEASRTMLASIGSGDFYALAGDHPALPGVDCTPVSLPQGKKNKATAMLPNGLRYVNYTVTQTGSNIMFQDPLCVYTFGSGPTKGLQAQMRILFGSVANQKNVTLPRGLRGQKLGDAWLLALIGTNEPDLTSTTRYMEGLAAAITATIRENGDPTNSAPALGSAFSTDTCVGIRWEWLAFPATLILLTLILMIATIMISRRSTRLGAEGYLRTPWKSSSLPLLWCGIRDETKAKYARFDEVEDMKSTGDDLRVTLRREVWLGGRPVNAGWHNQDRWALKEE